MILDNSIKALQKFCSVFISLKEFSEKIFVCITEVTEFTLLAWFKLRQRLHLWLHLGICHTTETRYSISYLQHSERGMCWMSWDQTRVTAEYIESSECLCTRMGLAVLLHDVECKHTNYLAIKWSQLHHADTVWDLYINPCPTSFLFLSFLYFW